MPADRSLAVCHLGRVPYAPAWTLQQQIQKRLIEAKRQAPPADVPNVLLLLEHPHVYTLGKSGDDAHLLLSEERLDAIGATFHRINRGGDVTYHGPGQLVGYPILDLDRFFTDLGRYLRMLEAVIIRTCASHGIEGARVDGRTGVWVGPDADGLERKICAMGVHCSRWVTSHGFAFNLQPDLDYFGHIVPCGITDRGVTSLAKETGGNVDAADVRGEVVQHVADLFEADTTTYDGDEARAMLADLVGAPVLEDAAA